MSVDSLIANPTIINELKSVFGGGGGITSLANSDNNLVVGVTGSTGNINLANNVEIQNNFKVDGNCDIVKQILLNGSSGSTGQLLTSGGSGLPIWSSLPSSLRIAGFANGKVTPNPDSQQITCGLINLSGMTAGKPYYVLCFGTYNNSGTTPPTVPSTLMSYSALEGSSTQLTTYDTQIYNVNTKNKVSYSYIVSNNAPSASFPVQSILYISGSPQINTISCDALDYFCLFAFQ